jgi:RNA-directed DNA polymerase
MTDKPFVISQDAFYEAFEEVRRNKGAAGIDGITIAQYAKKLDDNLYKLWNRMSSGTYFPKPVKQVLIPKKNGKLRPLGIPTVEDRVAQTVAKSTIEPTLDPVFTEDSYGYRPNKSALDAVAKARQRCFKYDWVLEFDIVGLFDNIDHELLSKAVDKHIDEKWVKLYLKRWSTAPVTDAEGITHERASGVSQGGVTSPIMANLFLHYAFDKWMEREFPHCPYERFADDAIIHCATEDTAQKILAALEQRMAVCHLKLHPDKTKIVYCKDSRRKGNYPNISFDFLGYTFCPRKAQNPKDKKIFTGFLPAVSNDAVRRFMDKIHEIRLKSMTQFELSVIAKILNPIIRGWMNYFGAFYPSRMWKALNLLNRALGGWVRRKYKKMASRKRANKWLRGVAARQPELFYHWSQGFVC